MALRRMFTLNIIDSDAFLDLSTGAQALYFHLSMRADDDGFLNNPKKIMRMIGAGEADLEELVSRGFLLSFPDGVLAVTHWRMHNALRKDRYTPTRYQDHLAALTLRPSGEYAPLDPGAGQIALPATVWQPPGNPG